MIEHLQAMGLEPGRAWAVAVGRKLSYRDPNNPKQTYTWNNHVAPTIAVEAAEHGILIIDPSLSQVGPLTLTAWATKMKVRGFEAVHSGLSQAEILDRQATRALQSLDLDAMVFLLRLDEPPILDNGGSGFRIGPDPPDGVSDYARQTMAAYLKLQSGGHPSSP
jgi:hypothetical protein